MSFPGGRSVMPAKIVMKGTSQMSLHERFTTLAQSAPAQPQRVQVNLRGRRGGRIGHSTVSNRRLAQQLASRASIFAAQRLKNRSIMQRLSARARLGFQRGGGMTMRGRGSGFVRNRLQLPFRSSNGFSRGGRIMKRFQMPTNRGHFHSPRGSFGRPNGSGDRMNLSAGTSRGGRGFSRGQGRGRGWGRGQGRGRGGSANGSTRSADDLDKELEDYMSKGKQTGDDFDMFS